MTVVLANGKPSVMDHLIHHGTYFFSRLQNAKPSLLISSGESESYRSLLPNVSTEVFHQHIWPAVQIEAGYSTAENPNCRPRCPSLSCFRTATGLCVERL
ncbi:hypothetical protein AVEN_97670-1 [Araneus ventricosus]|uniref:Uncharacterized protein n=1 Tax=Araneus ventricosus TaxID=182803 RepID=A0A4Y2GU84_ARAVE|nr:hypothetical protein AVEN_97670-1 [Araneus ventricosus]